MVWPYIKVFFQKTHKYDYKSLEDRKSSSFPLSFSRPLLFRIIIILYYIISIKVHH